MNKMPSGNQSLIGVDRLLAQGRFLEALALIPPDRALSVDDASLAEVLRAEVLLATGDDEQAAKMARYALGSGDSLLISRAHRVLAVCAFNAGDVDRVNEHLDQAAVYAGRCLDAEQVAAVDLARFSIDLKFERIDSALGRLPSLRKVVTRTGNPILLAQLRLYVARLEARRNNLAEAQRHLEHVRRMVGLKPNLWLEGLLEIDCSVVRMLLGDLDGSLEASQRALRLATDSGHHHTRVAAAVNTSHALERRGEFDKAREHIKFVLSVASSDRHVMRATLDCRANLLITAGRYDECRQLLAETAERAVADGGARPHWDAIAELFSQARLQLAERRFGDAVSILSHAIEISEQYGDEVWRRKLLLTRARAAALTGDSSGASRDLAQCTKVCSEPLGVAEYHASLGVVYRALTQYERAEPFLGRAERIAVGIAGRVLVRELLNREEGSDSVRRPQGRLPRPDLDSAVALLELSGHPHILGREAFAVIAGAGCAEAAALVVAGAGQDRVVEATGWSDREALAALRAGAEGTEVLALGPLRDQQWQLVVRPKTDLDAYTTFAAIRKLLATAVTLDQYRRDEKQRAALWPAEALDGDPESIWVSEQMAETLSIARRIAPTPLSILLTGETGTGKEMLARAIHRASDRADRPFLPFNCTAVPRDMLESQLFGHRKGAFTGADNAFPGVIRAAAGGTLFLDEIADISPELQPKLLRFLETHEIHPLGDPQPIKVDVRVIAATNASLEQLVAEGRFREDLFYRLNVVRLKLPPLRERREEIPPLVHHYLRRYGDEQHKERLTLSDETLEYLLLYAWPGNVRQLANEVRRMVALVDTDATLTPALLSPEIQASRRTIPADATADAEVRVALDQPLPAAVEMLEQLMVRRALERARGRVEEASKLLGISRKGLFLKRRRWALEVKPPSFV
jgi:DNA-binding NtrC family response regulator